MADVTVLVLNYMGRDLLERHLPAVARAVAATPRCEAWVVDNASTDGSVAYVREQFPEMRVLCWPRNEFLFTLNEAAARCDSRLVVLLNNDVAPTPDAFVRLIPHFDDPSVFAAAAKTLGPDGELQTARIEGKFDYGLLDPIHFVSQLTEPDDGPRPTLYAGGGTGMFDRARMLALGGFDRLLWPIYWEDVDLCYRAWKRGWKTIYEPSSVMYHQHPATTVGKRMSADRIKQIKFRNQILLTWKNVSDRRIFWQSFRTLLWHLRRARAHGEGWRLGAIAEALVRLPRALLRRRRDAVGVADRLICPHVYE